MDVFPQWPSEFSVNDRFYRVLGEAKDNFAKNGPPRNYVGFEYRVIVSRDAYKPNAFPMISNMSSVEISCTEGPESQCVSFKKRSVVFL